MLNLKFTATQQNDVYLIDMGNALSPAVSVALTASANQPLQTHVLMPTEQIIKHAIAEQEAMATELASAIQHAYSANVWPEALSAEQISSRKLSRLHSLLHGREKRFFTDDDSTAMLISMHARFLASAVKVMQLARAGHVEEAYTLLNTQYARNSRQVVWLLKNLTRRARYVKFESPHLTAARA